MRTELPASRAAGLRRSAAMGDKVAVAVPGESTSLLKSSPSFDGSPTQKRWYLFGIHSRKTWMWIQVVVLFIGRAVQPLSSESLDASSAALIEDPSLNISAADVAAREREGALKRQLEAANLDAEGSEARRATSSAAAEREAALRRSAEGAAREAQVAIRQLKDEKELESRRAAAEASAAVDREHALQSELWQLRGQASAMQASLHYDKGQQDRLVAAAKKVCEEFAASFRP